MEVVLPTPFTPTTIITKGFADPGEKAGAWTASIDPIFRLRASFNSGGPIGFTSSSFLISPKRS